MPARSNFHVPLPAAVHAELRSAADEEGTPATVLARRAIEEYLLVRKRHRVSEAIGAYVAEVAASESDLDGDLEAAAAEHLARLEE